MKITYHITRDDFIDAQKLHRSKSPRGIVRSLVLVAKVCVVAVLILLIVLASVTRDRNIWFTYAPLVGLLVIWVLLYWVWAPFSWRRTYTKDRRLQDAFTADISEDGVQMGSPTFDANLKWGLFLRFLESDRVFLLHQTDRLFNMFPKAAFAPAEIEEFRQLLRRKLPDK
jgi:hypothetical protein